MSRSMRLNYLGVLVGSLALSGQSNHEEAPNDALEIFEAIVAKTCFNPEHPTRAEKLATHRAILQEALEMIEGITI